MGRSLDIHRRYADSLTETAEELLSYASAESISLLAILRLATSNKSAPSKAFGQFNIPAVPAATISEQFASILDAARSAVQVSYRLHRDRFREDGGSHGFLGTAGALLLACRLPADGTPLAFKIPNKLSDMVYAAEPALPQQLPGLLDLVTLSHRADLGLRGRHRPRRLVDDMLAEMRQPLVDLVTRQAEVDLETLASMRIALCAVAIWMEVYGPDPLWSCVMGLAAIEARHRGVIDMEEVILLVREDLA